MPVAQQGTKVKSLMFDIETLATVPTAAVISIGICAFTQDGVIDSAGWSIKADHWHGTIDPNTVKWWGAQTDAARSFSFDGAATDATAAVGLRDFVRRHGAEEAWANDPEFDLVILKHWWARCEAVHTNILGEWPISYWASRSYRTITAEAKRLEIPFDGWSRMGVAHNPVDDACAQARAVIQIRHNLVGAKP